MKITDLLKASAIDLIAIPHGRCEGVKEGKKIL